MKYLLLVICLAFHGVYAQTVTFREIKLRPKPELYNVKENTIIYPLVITNNRSVDKLINDKIKLETLGEEGIPIRKALDEHISMGLINMYYEVTYKKNGILSLNIFGESCGAYCSSGYNYFNFDLKTGKSLAITDMVAENKIDSFKKIVFADKLKALTKYKKEELNYSNKDIDSAAINWAIEQVDKNCMGKADLENFSLSGSNIQIVDRCEFPHVIRALEPDYKLIYSYPFMRSFLKPKFLHLFLK